MIKKLFVLGMISLSMVSCSTKDITINRYEEIDGNTLTYKVTGDMEITKDNYVKYRDMIEEEIEDTAEGYKLIYVYYNNELLTCIRN